ncbi:MAG: hypothetical protein GY778_02615 [bacterium]|nr:hypothetical protein [bacterium]
MPAKRVPDCLRALGREEMPSDFQLGGNRYRHLQTFKHDFFAATGLYEGDGRRVVLKIGRRVGFLGLPLAWVGRLLARAESGHLRQVQDLDGVPELIGVWVGDSVVHDYVPGHVLSKGERVADDFFERLTGLLAAMHARQRAYVDLEKPQNVLVGDDGRPYLIDFQISWPWAIGFLTRGILGRWLCRRLQQGDRYHVRKLQRRFRPDQMTEEELAASYRRPWPVRLHRRVTRPATRFRRWVLSRVAPKRTTGERGALDDVGATHQPINPE